MGVIARWKKRRHCAHEVQWCIHGDAINAAGGNRAQCVDCGKLLPKLPTICTVSGKPH